MATTAETLTARHAAARPAAPAARRHDVDRLRIGATFLLFPFHVAKTFDVRPRTT